MQTNIDFEAVYASTLKECVSIIGKVAQHENDQISLLLSVGKKINYLLDHSPDKEKALIRLSRDIFIARGRMISYLNLSEYQQLYLKFETVEAVNKLTEGFLNDISIETLLKIAKQEKTPSKTGKNSDEFLGTLRKINKLLNKLEIPSEGGQIEDSDKFEIDRLIELIHDKAIKLRKLCDYDGKRQLALCHDRPEVAVE